MNILNLKLNNILKPLLAILVVQCLLSDIMAADCIKDDKCATCDSQTGNCIRCWSNYSLVGNKCAMDVGAVANCETYYRDNKDKCAICKPGFTNKWDDSTCATSFTVNNGGISSTVTVSCNTNCRTCKLQAYDTDAAAANLPCLVCNYGYAAIKKGGSSTCANDATANTQISNCLYEFGTYSSCYKCKTGYVLSADMKTCTVVATGYVDNCEQSEIDTTYCKRCIDGIPMINSKTCKKSFINTAIATMLIIVSVILMNTGW